ncbi:MULTISPECIES: ProQ/FINO family protein [Uliginosibacterium]|uniref:ProQ/FinO family protein n=1 Tax=Uliginosibacterium aquaticum TaxID=2731212 RepID=A0ABX2IEK5_9RHOO|nr:MULTISPECIES: ProQ/FinO family protein [Uliginosibacterium]MDO6385182.1 ProQ/FinO family protein [Uliginosibacterium sp. 31-12]NSL55100.1 ProQ/FinO family protein [Uliginosibacterium aquaticum]PLK48917.1 osmoprotectant transporter activator [Uliginosibacterium sp. TH139]
MTDASSPSTPAAPAASASALLKQLQQQYKLIGEHQPMAIGIDKQLLAARADIPAKLLRGALGMHTRSVRYLKNLQSATQRFNLDGSPAGEVSEEQRGLASKELIERFKKRAEEHKAEKAAKEKAEKEARAETERQEKLALLASKFGRK